MVWSADFQLNVQNISLHTHPGHCHSNPPPVLAYSQRQPSPGSYWRACQTGSLLQPGPPSYTSCMGVLIANVSLCYDIILSSKDTLMYSSNVLLRFAGIYDTSSHSHMQFCWVLIVHCIVPTLQHQIPHRKAATPAVGYHSYAPT